MTKTSSVHSWLLQASQLLSGCSDQPALEAQVLLAHVLVQPRAWVIAHPEFLLSNEQDEQLHTLLAQRLQGVPLPYLLGHWEFYGLDFLLDPHVLIPRPETEFLVQEALQWIHGRSQILHVVDVGTGSGCIAVSLAKNAPALTVTGIDISRPALDVARQNVVRHRVQEQVHLLQGDLLQPCRGRIDLVCANLPYIPSQTLAGLEVARREPRLALDGGWDGLRLIEKLLAQTAMRMAPGGLLLLEIESGQGESAAELASSRFPKAAIEVLPDLSGKPRLLKIYPDRD